MSNTKGSGRRSFLRMAAAGGAGAVVGGAATASVMAKGAHTVDRNILKWPMPDTVSAKGREKVAAAAALPALPLPPLAVQRAMISGMQTSMGKPMLARHGVHVEETKIAGVPVRIIYPKGMAALGEGPVLLNLHGGGFQLDSGSLTETIPIASLTGLPVVAVLYRLAPEHPYPAALEDALAVYSALEKDRQATNIGVFGTSAGACLSGQLLARLTSLKRPMPACLGFFSGSADLATSGDSESWMPLPGGEKSLAEAVSGYIGATPVTDPILSPIHGELSGFPPTLLVSSTRDVLLSETSIFGRALLERGVDSRLVVFDGLPHAFWSYMDIPETDEANALMAKFLKVRVAGG